MTGLVPIVFLVCDRSDAEAIPHEVTGLLSVLASALLTGQVPKFPVLS